MIAIRQTTHCRRHADDGAHDRARQKPGEHCGGKRREDAAQNEGQAQIAIGIVLRGGQIIGLGTSGLLDLGGSLTEAIELALGFVLTDLDDLVERHLGFLAGLGLRLGELVEIEIGSLLHVVDGLQQIRRASCDLLGRSDALQHPLAIGENIAIGAVAAQQQEAAQIDGLLQHGLQGVIDQVDELVRTGLLGGRFGRDFFLGIHECGNAGKNGDQYRKRDGKLAIQGKFLCKHE
ncbi:hypothetical protein RHSP_01999 [Rhizobium freirei PRF 81]|uniref:Uncharacterized protein n=1 Tax=Rhizobium freirei PRF 81 TaxID=363754 RepID=N6UFV4_9HYPH|nr:hypothetical protein RHSP_01999 [Rhizobium freirei PRF 81]